MQLKTINTFAVTLMLTAAVIILFSTGFLEFPAADSAVPSPKDSIFYSLSKSDSPEPFRDLFGAFKKWDSEVGCAQFRETHRDLLVNGSKMSSLQNAEGGIECGELQMKHVSVLVKGWTWVPDNMDNLYSCRCGLSCLWTKSSLLADKPDALLFETTTPPILDTLVYWSSSRCLPQRNQLAKKILSLLPTHSFGKCLNNVGGLDQALSFYPECVKDPNEKPKWWDHLHCAMSHYKFVLAIENTMTESYVTEKLFYALDSGAVPIYFGAPNVWDFIPPHSIIDGTQFSSIEQLASYVKSLANDPVAYAEYHAWRRCGVLGNYGKTRAASLDTLPCRLCEQVSEMNGRDAKAL
ncbi:alpha-(1,4)-fucosyltransferase-like isoform X2 [Salvia splendens]|uniref:alpha-(1,4)-fucosyltransferase-like isoform X2 n=1 Tax=Salvia splendens TaxID=180675 RepID=UPI001C25BDB2|nr:alpha-(1,4)-fucosyltransferase-like isoform X2 [Salvia splendens]